jgi:hypothetical protein
MRVTPIVDEATVAEASMRLFTPGLVYVGYYNETTDERLFPGLITPIQAGRMFQVSAAQL